MLIPLMAVAIFLAQSQLRSQQGMLLIGFIFAALALGFVAFMVRKL